MWEPSALSFNALAMLRRPVVLPEFSGIAWAVATPKTDTGAGRQAAICAVDNK